MMSEGTATEAGPVGKARCIWSLLLTLWPVGKPAEPSLAIPGIASGKNPVKFPPASQGGAHSALTYPETMERVERLEAKYRFDGNSIKRISHCCINS